MLSKSISILGCGWLGLPLARALAASGYQVKGSTTTPQKLSVLRDSNVIPYSLTLNPSVEGERIADFFKSDVLFFNVPFRRDLADPRFYLEQVRSVLPYVVEAGVKLVIFASSTLAYPALNQVAKESDVFVPSDERAKVLIEAEQLLLQDRRFATVILRFAGLYGPDREIGNFFKTGRVPKDADTPVNLVHLEDCIGVVKAVIEQKPVGEIFNVCGDEHPLRRALYTQAARAQGLQDPVFDESPQVCYPDAGMLGSLDEKHQVSRSGLRPAGLHKIIDNSKVKERLGYRFIYPSPLGWIGRHGTG